MSRNADPNLRAPSCIFVAHTLLNALFITRPMLWIPVWGFAVLGYFRAGQVGLEMCFGGLWNVHWIGEFALIVAFSCAVGAVYVVNQLADLDVDRDNEGFPLLVRGGISRRTAYAAAGVCAAVSMIVPVAAGRPGLAAISAAALLVGVVYSCRPLSLSGRPGADFLSNAVGYGTVAFGAGWYLSPAGLSLVSPLFALSMLPYFFLMCAGSISSTVPDIDGDRAHGKRTTAVAMGAFPAQMLAGAMVLCAGAVAWYAHDRLALVTAGLVIPLYVAYAVARGKALAEATYKVGGALLMIAAAGVAPLFAPMALVVFLGTRIYFRRRHGVAYPSLLPSARSTSGKAGT